MVEKRAKICFLHKQYIIIHSDDPASLRFENIFSMVHSGHMVQIVNLSEIDKKEYSQVFNSEDEMNKLVKEVENELLYIDGIGRSW